METTDFKHESHEPLHETSTDNNFTINKGEATTHEDVFEADLDKGDKFSPSGKYRERHDSINLLTEEEKSKKGLGTMEGAFAILSTIIGGGIVGVPYSLLHAGIPVGILLHAIVAGTCLYSCQLYIQAKDLVSKGNGIKVESMYEIGFILFKRRMIYIIAGIICLASTGLMMVYFIVFGDIFASISL